VYAIRSNLPGDGDAVVFVKAPPAAVIAAIDGVPKALGCFCAVPDAVIAVIDGVPLPVKGATVYVTRTVNADQEQVSPSGIPLLV
jgi:hypothetical protein